MKTDRQVLDSLIEVAEKQARLVLLELKAPMLAPIWVLRTRTGKSHIIQTSWADEAEKHFYKTMLRQWMHQKQVVAYSFLTEAWAARLEPGEWDEGSGNPLAGVPMPSQHPKRQEIVIVCACTAKLARWARWLIIRQGTEIIELRPDPVPDQTTHESWLTQMLK